MNLLLELKGKFNPKDNNASGGGVSLNKDDILVLDKFDYLINLLTNIINLWQGAKFVKNILIDVKYERLIPKSSRISSVLYINHHDNKYIVGARFSDDIDMKHIVTYYVPEKHIRDTISDLIVCKKFFSDKYGSSLKGDVFNSNDDVFENVERDYDGFSKTKMKQLLCDACHVNSFAIPSNKFLMDERVIVTFYKTEESLLNIFSKLGLKSGLFGFSILDEYTAVLSKDNAEIIEREAPYLIANSTTDFFEKLEQSGFSVGSNQIPSPTNEPVIGVIDTPLYEDVYFKEWADIHNEEYDRDSDICNHGTKVSSIIVDGESLNPSIKDDCGRFRVRHFGILTQSRGSSSELMRKIESIVKENQDIHVWNLSLGGNREISKSYISYEASVLDRIQNVYNCIFVVAGTNKRKPDIKEQKIAPPADSLNSLVVNSININGDSADYSRTGPVLSYFLKPDICYYGGDDENPLCACSPYSSIDIFTGTSSSAPWIARKLSYLIDKMNLPREVAKALIIDSAAGWNYNIKDEIRYLRGYGKVPTSIKDILRCNDDEIKFYIFENTLAYKTYNYSLPIPKDKNNKYPFITRATLCYFPRCYRNQGVDYTETELNLKFGRINDKDVIDSIGSVSPNSSRIEKELRDYYQKWDNTKFKRSEIKSKNMPIKSYENRDWGIEITRNERNEKTDESIKFGLVITLKNVLGDNQINDFISGCALRRWLVNEISIDNQIDIYEESQEDIYFNE